MGKTEGKLSRVMMVMVNLLVERRDLRITDPRLPDAFG